MKHQAQSIETNLTHSILCSYSPELPAWYLKVPTVTSDRRKFNSFGWVRIHDIFKVSFGFLSKKQKRNLKAVISLCTQRGKAKMFLMFSSVDYSF